MEQANSVFVITLAIILVGYGIRRAGFVSEADGKAMSRLLMHTTFPALMIVSALRIPLQPTLFLIPFVCIGLVSLLLLAAWFWFARYPTSMRGLLTMAVGASNIGMFGFPIIESIWGRDALVYAILFDIGNTLVIFGFVYPIGSYFAPHRTGRLSAKALLARVLRLPPFLGMIIGLTINALHISLPVLTLDFLDILAKANKPLVLLLLGIYLRFQLERTQTVAIGKVLLLRLVGGFAVMALLYAFIPERTLFRTIMVVCVSMPIGMTLLPFSDELGFDSRVAGTLVNASLVISFTLLWLLVAGLGLI